MKQSGHCSHGKQNVRYWCVSACLHLDTTVRIVIQDEIRKDVVDDLVWHPAKKTERRVDGAVECAGKVVFVAWVVVFTGDSFNIITVRHSVLRMLGELDLLVSGVVTWRRRCFAGDVFSWLSG